MWYWKPEQPPPTTATRSATGTGLCICIISFTLVLATGVKLIMVPFASASGPEPPAILHPDYNRTAFPPHKQGFLPSNSAPHTFDKPITITYNTMQPCATK